jgi:hypothetical protein
LRNKVKEGDLWKQRTKVEKKFTLEAEINEPATEFIKKSSEMWAEGASQGIDAVSEVLGKRGGMDMLMQPGKE